MRMTKAQLDDLEVSQYFIPTVMNDIEISPDDKIKYFEWSQEGKHKELIDNSKMDGFNALFQGKRWRGINMQMFEDGIIEGTVPYLTILGKEKDDTLVPVSVKNFMKKEMFQGRDADVIERVYNEVF